MISSFRAHKNKLCEERGFSILELLLVISIFVVITTVTLVSYNKFSNQTLLTNLAYDIGLTLREAQVFAFSVREETEVGGGFTSAYGIHFLDAEDSTTYIFFADVNNNNRYDCCAPPLPPGTDPVCNTECIERFDLQRGYAVSNVCAIYDDMHLECSGAGLTGMHITFERPNPDAVIVNEECPATQYREALIAVQAQDGTERYVTVSTTGQISVHRENPYDIMAPLDPPCLL